ncbi:MAG: energy-coupling factor transport system ATP-binding protein [Thermoanaerobacterium sp.]|jgi:ABC transporter./Cobalt ATP-binding cassette C terminal.|uniref:Energy-coupling factor transporter ATP-binding protein EcfA2 n=1 Tax=Thermoanaerobacterium butyriciformans TaxID=1702242 RepID=A0ABS4NE94_9THEO|nr:energy-coupling factor transporter ATPase [Thermoanaerobacterium butyriciformans]MDI3477102.1 energy-coupling factor transport system ATP-binding protein [Thermoanaerobacterium sp.]WHE07568.1 energy-coupling factor transporter ATPase [Thermoanaerobacterium thermosaccharolyticum]MBP2071998.1 energy-coupling factor transport system ATP-binding protein [Thermoanaerobacterium butyriciformans]MDK2806461.1 energy-coupling factor transport system ATP-binding protein [Thermoanaerobacterium sp.]MDN5
MSIQVENISFIYNEGTPFESEALKDVSFTIEDNEFVGIIGHTGSGKSTLIQHLNGLLKPTSGRITINGIDITSTKNLKNIRREVGIVFQYPEHQLFEETIYKDIAFGPSNLGLPDDEIKMRVFEAMKTVGLDVSMKDMSPFELSGGERRRVAIAGVLSMMPKILILDEPTAGLDPRGRDEILGKIKEIHEKYEMTTILVSHSMEDIAKLVNKIIVMHEGKVSLIGTPREVFKNVEKLEQMGLGVPQITYLMRDLRKNGIELPDDILTVDEAKRCILEYLRGVRDA